MKGYNEEQAPATKTNYNSDMKNQEPGQDSGSFSSYPTEKKHNGMKPGADSDFLNKSDPVETGEYDKELPGGNKSFLRSSKMISKDFSEPSKASGGISAEFAKNKKPKF